MLLVFTNLLQDEIDDFSHVLSLCGIQTQQGRKRFLHNILFLAISSHHLRISSTPILFSTLCRSTVKSWSFSTSISVCLPSDFFYRIICHRSSIFLTALREDCLINIFLACYGGLSPFCVTPQLCVDKWHVVGLTEPGLIYIYIYLYTHTHIYIYRFFNFFI